jgi:hypothetical protein
VHPDRPGDPFWKQAGKAQAPSIPTFSTLPVRFTFFPIPLCRIGNRPCLPVPNPVPPRHTESLSISLPCRVVDSIPTSNYNTQGNRCNQGGQTAFGGGIGITGGYATIVKSTISYNSACRGGGIAKGGTGTFYLENSTVAKDTAYSRGGGILFYAPSGDAILRFNTIAENVAGAARNGDDWREA